jgi:cytoskeleton protein RodZ
MATVADTLSSERRRQGKSIADVVEATKIRTRMIDALEHSNWAILPDPAYVKGYIQSYARYLEIPAEPLLDMYRAETARQEHSSSPADRYLADIPAEQIVPERHEQHAIPRELWIAVAAVLVVIALIICGIAQLFRAGPTTPLPKPSEPTGTAGVPAPGDATTTVTTPETTGDFKIRITVKEGMASWVRVTLDGLEAYQGTLNGGESREWLVSDAVGLKIGKPASVNVARDGKPVTLPKGTNVQLTLRIDQ